MNKQKAMTPKQIELVENSWDFILVNTTEAGDVFYRTLFEVDPDLRDLFGKDIKVQSQKLVALITFAVHKLRNVHEIVRDVEALGKRHEHYKVQRKHYSSVGTALLRTLEQCLGERWNSETKEAWITLYDMLSSTMIGNEKAFVK